MKKLLILTKPISIVALSLLIITIGFRYYLYLNSTQLIKEFKNQNFREIYSADTLKISSRLNSLSAVINWICIEGKVNNKYFYNMRKGDCSSGFFQQKTEISIPANKFNLVLTTKLHKEIEDLFILIFLLQSFLILTLVRFTRQEEKIKHLNDQKINKIARRMSHDIRSPLATLNTIVDTLNNIPHNEKELLKKSIIRINDISNNLLRDTRREEVIISNLPELKHHNLNKILEEVSNDKMIEFSPMNNIKITFTCPTSNAYCFIDEVEFRSIISNLINNSIDARSGNITINLILNINLVTNSAIINVIDNGKGISAKTLAKIGVEEISTKKEGNGLGLIQAYETIRSWNGNIEISSVLRQGTDLKIILPLASNYNPKNILIDNDELVRLTWDSSARKKGIDFSSFENFEELNKKIQTIPKDSIIYIDSQLDDDILGENIAIELNKDGFTNIIITSGHKASKFSHLTFLKGIKDKSPPW